MTDDGTRERGARATLQRTREKTAYVYVAFAFLLFSPLFRDAAAVPTRATAREAVEASGPTREIFLPSRPPAKSG